VKKFYIFIFLIFFICSTCTISLAMIGIDVLSKNKKGETYYGYGESWAVLIGINKYKYLPQLEYAVRDAEDIRKVLISQFGFKQENIFTLFDNEAAIGDIKNVLGETLRKKTGKNDKVLIFFAGHGHTLETPAGGNLGFLIPVNGSVRSNEIYATCLSMSEVNILSNLIPAKHILFLVDACFSGLAISSRGMLPPETEDYLEKITKASGRMIITAGTKGEEVIEKVEWAHNAFSHQLLEGFQTGMADENSDGLITFLELALYLKSNVSRITNNRQTPQFGHISGEGEFVFIIKGEKDVEKKRDERDKQRISLIDTLNFAELDNDANKVWENKKYELVIDYYTKLIEHNPKVYNYYFRRGFAYSRLGNNEEAVRDFTKAIELNPKLDDAYYNRGIAYFKLGKYKAAIRDYAKVIELNPKYYLAIIIAGLIAVAIIVILLIKRLSKYRAKAIDYSKTAEINQKFAKSYYKHGVDSQKSGKYEQALLYYTKVIKADPKFAKAYYNRGLIYTTDLDKHREAIRDFTKAIELDPEFADAYYNQGVVYQKLGKFKAAADNYNNYLRINYNKEREAEIIRKLIKNLGFKPKY